MRWGKDENGRRGWFESAVYATLTISAMCSFPVLQYFYPGIIQWAVWFIVGCAAALMFAALIIAFREFPAPWD